MLGRSGVLKVKLEFIIGVFVLGVWRSVNEYLDSCLTVFIRSACGRNIQYEPTPRGVVSIP